MLKIIVFIYGLISYAVFFTTFLFAICFVGNIFIPKTIDSGIEVSFTQALLINILLLSLFAVQHSVMARQWFKNWWTKFVPQVVERSTFVLIASLLLTLLFHQWHPMPGVIWNIENQFGYFILLTFFWIGWIIVLLSTFMTDHFHLFGLRQVYEYLRTKPFAPVDFKVPALYQFVRHPLYLGFIIAFWSTPQMTVGHLVFSMITTVYILIAIQFEESDLINQFGESYNDYRKRVPMIIPLLRKK